MNLFSEVQRHLKPLCCRPLQAQTTFSDGPLPSEHKPLPLLENLEKMGKKCAAAAATAPWRPATVVPRLAAAARSGARGRGSTVQYWCAAPCL